MAGYNPLKHLIMQDLVFYPSFCNPTYMTVHFKYSKTDHFAKGHIVTRHVTNKDILRQGFFTHTVHYFCLQIALLLLVFNLFNVFFLCLRRWGCELSSMPATVLHRCSYHYRNSRSTWTLAFRVFQAVYSDYKSLFTPGLQGDGCSRP